MMGWLKRYRHSKGFGIHSPFAFRFVTEVIEEQLPYYDYSVIKNEVDRLLYRTACRFNPKAVCALGVDSAAVMMACPGAVAAAHDSCDMLLADTAADMGAVAQALRREGVVAVVKGRALKSVRRYILDVMDQAGYGMSFDNERDMMIIVMNPKLPRQDFAVRF